jgi:RHS repeat-associated protein
MPRPGFCRHLVLVVFVLALVAAFPALAAAQSTTQVVEYYSTDALGSVRAVTKKVGPDWVAARHDFMPFGEEAAPPPPPPSSNRLFTGKERDGETGMDYFGARYYRANVGRFTTVDPELNVKDALVDPQRWNRYAYARNNPLKYVDPDGRDIAVIENHATSGNPFGHTAVAITGQGVFSFGNSTKFGSSLSDYVDDQASRRNTTIYIIKTTPEQDAAALKEALRQVEKGKLTGVITDNCSTRSNEILTAAGFPPAAPSINPAGPIGTPKSTVLPGSAGQRVTELPAGTVTVVVVPKGAKRVPEELSQFDPRKEKK